MKSAGGAGANIGSAILHSKRASTGRCPICTSRARRLGVIGVGVYCALGAGSVVSGVSGTNVAKAAVHAGPRAAVVLASTARSTVGFGLVGDLGAGATVGAGHLSGGRGESISGALPAAVSTLRLSGLARDALRCARSDWLSCCAPRLSPIATSRARGSTYPADRIRLTSVTSEIIRGATLLPGLTVLAPSVISGQLPELTASTSFAVVYVVVISSGITNRKTSASAIGACGVPGNLVDLVRRADRAVLSCVRSRGANCPHSAVHTGRLSLVRVLSTSTIIAPRQTLRRAKRDCEHF